MPASSDLRPDVHRRLAHACLQYLADAAVVRVLHIKGEALHPVLAEERSQPSDCDVLVHPAGIVPYVATLQENGWRLRTGFEGGSVFGHAATLYNPTWGTVDVHRHFPSLDLDAEVTFEHFWARRDTRELGGAACQVPDLLCQRLMLLVHAARDESGHAEHDIEFAWEQAGAQERAEIDALSDLLGARVPLALVTGREERAVGEHQEFLWRALHQSLAACCAPPASSVAAARWPIRVRRG